MSSSPRSTLRRAAAAVAVPVVALAAVAGPTRSPVAAAEPGAPLVPADAALDWLGGEVVANDGMLTVTFGDDVYDDPGLTLDAVLALAAGGQGGGPAVAAARAALPAAMPDYVTGFAGGDARAAGAVAKTLLVEEVLGSDVSPGYDLEADLRDLMAVDGDHPGRFHDREGWGDFSNGLGQAFAVLALARTDGGVPAPAVGYLLDQQCSDGSFRLYYDGGNQCTDPAQGDPDATALALMALLAVPGDGDVATARAAAADHLVALQGAGGGISGTGAVNANTTGLAGAALRGAGRSGPADAAASFVRSLQWTTSCDDVGAVAYDAPALAASVEAGVLVDRSQWSRASAQGALGLGLPAYGSIGSADPVAAGLAPISCTAAPGPTPTTPTTAPPATSGPTVELRSSVVVAGEVLEGTASGFEPGETVLATLHSTPRLLGSVVADAEGSVRFAFRVPADIEPGMHRLVLTGQTSGRTASIEVEVQGRTSPGTLPATGTSLALAGVGSGLVILGVALVQVAPARRRRASVIER